MQYGGGLSPQVLALLGIPQQGYRYVSPEYGWAYTGNSLDGRARWNDMPQEMRDMQSRGVSNPGNYVDWNAVNATTTRQMNEAKAREAKPLTPTSGGLQYGPARQPTQFDAQTYEAQALNSVQFERNRQAVQAMEMQRRQRDWQGDTDFLKREWQQGRMTKQQASDNFQDWSRQNGLNGNPLAYGGTRMTGNVSPSQMSGYFASQGQQYVPGYGAIGQISPQTQAFAQQVAGGNMNGYQKALAYANQFGEQTGPQSPNYFAARGW